MSNGYQFYVYNIFIQNSLDIYINFLMCGILIRSALYIYSHSSVKHSQFNKMRLTLKYKKKTEILKYIENCVFASSS